MSREVHVYTLWSWADAMVNEMPILHNVTTDMGRKQEAEYRRKACAKKVVKDGKEMFFIKETPSHALFDPLGTDGSQKKSEDYKFRRVNEAVFDKYVCYLRTGRKFLFIEAQRNAM